MSTRMSMDLNRSVSSGGISNSASSSSLAVGGGAGGTTGAAATGGGSTGSISSGASAGVATAPQVVVITSKTSSASNLGTYSPPSAIVRARDDLGKFDLVTQQAIECLVQSAPAAIPNTGAKPPKKLLGALEHLVALHAVGALNASVLPAFVEMSARQCLHFDDRKLQQLLQHFLNSLTVDSAVDAEDIVKNVGVSFVLNTKDAVEQTKALSRICSAIENRLLEPQELLKQLPPSLDVLANVAQSPLQKSCLACICGFLLINVVALGPLMTPELRQSAGRFLAKMVPDASPNVSLTAITALADAGFATMLEFSSAKDVYDRISDIFRMRRRTHMYSVLRCVAQLARSSRYQQNYLPPDQRASQSSQLLEILSSSSFALFPECVFAAVCARIWLQDDLRGILSSAGPSAELSSGLKSAASADRGIYTAAIALSKQWRALQKRVLALHCAGRASIDTDRCEFVVVPLLHLVEATCTDGRRTLSAGEQDVDVPSVIDFWSAIVAKPVAPGSSEQLTTSRDATIASLCRILHCDSVGAPLRESILWFFGKHATSLFGSAPSSMTAESAADSLFAAATNATASVFDTVMFLVQAQALMPDALLRSTCVRTLLAMAWVKKGSVLSSIKKFLLATDLLDANDITEGRLLQEMDAGILPEQEIARRLKMVAGY